MANDLAMQIKNSLEKEDAQTKILSFFGDDKEKATKFKSALAAISQNEMLKNCTPKSIITSAFNLAEVGLEINPILSQCYILTYKNNKKELISAEPVISYKGWQTLIERTGKKVKAFSVFNCDKFELDLSDFDEKITFIPNLNERKESNDKWYQENLKGVLVKIKDMKDGYVKNIFVSVDKIEKIKGMSKSLKGEKPQYSPYNNWAEEMYLAKAIKYCLSREALNFKDENIAKAIQVDNQLDKKLQDDNKEAKKDALDDIIEAEPLENENNSDNDTLPFGD
ncbi:TPA: recombinase RecT [Campylobacter jejuni]|nr:recombinase RecT [Campylobacter jejuni]